MTPTLLHLYGPLKIQSYGFMIAVGALTTILLAKRDPKLKALLSFNDLLDVATVTIISCVVGARILFTVEQNAPLSEFFAIWNPGFSFLGSLIAGLITVPLYLQYKQIPILPFLDRIAIYVPLLHSIARIGCFMAGCCYGIPYTGWASVTYTHPDSLAPLGVSVLPAQLISAVSLFCIFVFLFLQRNKTAPSGYFLSTYLLLAGLERFLLDFIRTDTTSVFFSFSQTQLLAACIIIIGLFIQNRSGR